MNPNSMYFSVGMKRRINEKTGGGRKVIRYDLVPIFKMELLTP